METFLSSIYVDDLVTGASDTEVAYELYLKAKLRLAVAGFKLRKFVTNSEKLRRHIQGSESRLADSRESTDGESTERSGSAEGGESADGGVTEPAHAEEEQSYAKSSLGNESEERPGMNKVLGIQWDVTTDEFSFDIGSVAHAMESSRGVWSVLLQSVLTPWGLYPP